MTVEEISNTFDTYFNTATKTAGLDISIGVNEYDKSVFLTKAQEEKILGLYSGKNVFGESFEQTEEIRRYLASLVKNFKATEEYEAEELFPLSTDSHFYQLPSDLWFVTLESVKLDTSDSCKKDLSLEVIPTTQDDWHRIKNNPFRGPNDRRALRFDYGDGIVEIVCIEDIAEYDVRYLSRPKPIILVPLTEEGLSIDGETEVHGCSLPDSLHDDLVLNAVSIALASYMNKKSEQ